MDKTLEVILVATVLVVAAVILVGLLQGQAGSFGGFAENQTTTAGCGVAKSQYCSAVDGGSNTDRSNRIAADNSGCGWSDGGGGSTSPSSVC